MINRLALVSVSLMLLLGCQEEQNPPVVWASGSFLAQLQLDSSVVMVSEVAGDLEVPWEITLDPDEEYLWFTEHKGTVNRLDLETLERRTLLQIPDVHHVKSRGLLGMVLHPDFNSTPHIFLHYTFVVPIQEDLEKIMTRLVRYTFTGDTLAQPHILLDSIPGKAFHNGSRMVITEDLKLFISIGDIGETDHTQDVNYIAGKILRLHLDGSVPDDNPFPDNPVWSWGHRNPQGMVWTPNGALYISDHGPFNDDEINLIVRGGNYGWPDVQGFADLESEKQYASDSLVILPLKAWTPTIAVAGLDYYASSAIPEWRHSLMVTNLKGQALRVLNLNEKGNQIVEEHIYLLKKLGRIRDLCVARNGDVFLATSNKDWHPQLQPWMYDSLPSIGDRIIRLHKNTGAKKIPLTADERPALWQEDTILFELPTESWEFKISQGDLDIGERLYLQHCAPCHREDGTGAQDLIPPLANTEWVYGDKSRLIRSVLTGLSHPITVNGVEYEEEMPGFAMLSDVHIANILSYIRGNFGNRGGVVIPGEVYEERKALGM